MRNLGRRLLAALALLGMAQTAAAAPSPAAPGRITNGVAADAPSGCVLHVWPGADAKSSYAGWFHGGAVNGDKRGIKGYPNMRASVLATGVQRDLLNRVDWSGQLAVPGLAVVVHEQPPEAQDDLARATPLVADRPACYAEVLIHSVLVESEVFSANTVRVMLVFKLWKASAVRPWTYTTMDTEKVRLDRDAPDLAETSLKDGFAAAVSKSLHTGYFWH